MIVATSFNFPHAGKLLALTFILFAGWFSDVVVPGRDYPKLAATGLLVLFGNINVAVPFLLDLFGIPADTFHLFNVTSVVNARFGTLVAGSHTIAVALLGTWALAGGWHVDARRIGRYVAITALLVVVTVFGVQTRHRPHRHQRVRPGQSHREDAVAGDPRAGGRIPPQRRRAGQHQHRAPRTIGSASAATLRVGYLPDSLPFVYENAAGRLVGFDVEMAHELAAELAVKLELVPVERDRLVERLESGYCDIVMSGLAVTPARAAELRLSTSYLDETLALVVRDEARDRFATWSGIRGMGSCPSGVPRVPYYVAKLQAELPRGEADDRGRDERALRRGVLGGRHRAHRRAGLDADPPPPRLLGRRAAARRAEGAAGLCDGQRRPAPGVVRRHLDRAEAERRHRRPPVRTLDSRTRRGGPPPTVVGDPRRPALGPLAVTQEHIAMDRLCSRVPVVLVVAAMLAAPIALSAGVKVRSEYDKSFDFRGLTTWAWHPEGAGDVRMAVTADDNPAAMKERFEPVILDAVQKEMAGRGLNLADASGTPQLYVNYYVLISTNQSRQTMGQFLPTVPEWGIPPFSYGATQSLKVFEEGSLVLDVTSAKTRQLIWRGMAVAELQRKSAPQDRDTRLRAAIAEVVKKFPKTS